MISVGPTGLWTDSSALPCPTGSRSSCGLVERLDLRTGRIEKSTTIRPSTFWAEPLATAATVWVTNPVVAPAQGQVIRIDPASLRRIGAPIILPQLGGPQGLVSSPTGIWVALAGGYVVRVDPTTGTLDQPIRVGSGIEVETEPMAVARGELWVLTDAGLVRLVPPGR